MAQMKTAFFGKVLATALPALVLFVACADSNSPQLDEAQVEKPNFILIMTDDQGWGQTGYYGHPVLETPNLDAMAAAGLRFDRFYAASPVCSPTRASILTGRAPDRTGVMEHGYALRLQEKTLAQALQAAGYVTGHFGKWHLNGIRGPGVPVLGDDSHSPGAFGFDTWLSMSNFFDMNPLMSRQGNFEEFEGDSSAIIVSEALEFIAEAKLAGKPFFAVIWDGSPHAPWKASEADRKAFANLDTDSRNHHAELAAFDRSVGVLRQGLRDLDVAENTLLWFNSDNGGLSQVSPSSTGGLRGYKGSVWEGGLRVPGIVEWPAVIDAQVTDYLASTEDIFPTIADILHLPDTILLDPVDGTSLLPLFKGLAGKRVDPLVFRYRSGGALVEDRYKLITDDFNSGEYRLYDLLKDPGERVDIAGSHPDELARMSVLFEKWSVSVDASIDGADYAEGTFNNTEPEPRFWTEDERYEPWFEEWASRPEYKRRLQQH